MDGPLLLALAIGLEVVAGVGRVIDESGIRLIALKEIEHVRFLAPVYPGETIFTVTEFLGDQSSSRPGRRNMSVKTELHKGDDKELVMQAFRTFIFDLDET
jgi:acyl dehydratase